MLDSGLFNRGVIGSAQVQFFWLLHRMAVMVDPINPDNKLKCTRMLVHIKHLDTGGGPGNTCTSSYFSLGGGPVPGWYLGVGATVEFFLRAW